MNTKTTGLKCTAEVGDIMGFEVEYIDRATGLIRGMLDTGQGAVTTLKNLAETADCSRQTRFDALREPHGDEPGSTFNVRVIDAYVDSRNRHRIFVSEKAVETRLFHKYIDSNTAESDAVPSNVVPADVLANARQKQTLNHTIRGVVVGDAPGGGKRVDIGKFVAILSREELCGTRPESLRKGGAVKVKILTVDEHGIALTRKGVA